MNGREFAFRVQTPLPWWLLVPLGVVLAAAMVYLYRRERNLVGGRTGKWLTALRVILPLLLVAMLFEPLVAAHWSERLKGRLILLIDKSLSMDLRDTQRSAGEKLRTAEALGLIPPGTTDGSIAAARQAVLEEAVAWKALGDAASAAVDDPSEKAVQRLKERHSAAERAAKAADQKLRKATETRADPARKPIASALGDIAKKLDGFEDTSFRPMRTDASGLAKVDDLSDLRQRAGRIKAHSLEVARQLRELDQAIRKVQDDDDALRVNSADDRVKAALMQVDGLKRRDIAARELKGGKTNLLRKLSDRFQVVAYTMDTKAEPIDTAKLLEGEGDKAQFAFPSDGRATDMAHCLSQAVDPSETAADIAGVLLVTDGQTNQGEDPMAIASALAGRNVKVFALGIGSAEPSRDIAISKIETSDTVFAEDEVHVVVEVKSGGFEGRKLPLRIERDGKTVAERELKLIGNGQRQQEELSFVPEGEGSLLYKATVPLQDGEVIKDNNEQAFWINVIKEKVRVLYVEGEPRWEFRFLKNALVRDKNVEVNYVVVHRDAESMARGGADEPSKFPRTREALYHYDALILGDLPPDRFFPAELKNIEKLIGDNGSTLIAIGGPTFMPDAYSGTPIEELLPVTLNDKPPSKDEKRALAKRGFKPLRTSEGRRSPLLRMSLDEAVDAKVWEKLMPMYRHNWITTPKPGATVLMYAPRGEAEDNEDAGYVLLAQQSYGVGKVMFLGVDETWRWRYKVGDLYHHKFWGQVMRWATAGKLSGRDKYVHLGTHKTAYSVGEAVRVQAKVLDSNLAPLNAGRVNAVLYSGNEEKENVALDFIPDSEGRYRGQFVALPKGDYTLKLYAPHLPEGGISKAQVSFTVRDVPSAERVDVHLNAPLLSAIAQATGGKFYTIDNASTLPDDIPPAGKSIPRTFELLVWSWYPFLIVLCAVIVTEWVIRKRAGLM